MQDHTGTVFLRRGGSDKRHHSPVRKAVQRQPYSVGVFCHILYLISGCVDSKTRRLFTKKEARTS